MLSHRSGCFAFLVCYLGTEDLAPPAGKNRLISSGSRKVYKSFPTEVNIVFPMKKAVLTITMKSEMSPSFSSLSFLLSEQADWLLKKYCGLTWCVGHREPHWPGGPPS